MPLNREISLTRVVESLIAAGEASAPFTEDNETVSRIVPWQDGFALVAADGDGWRLMGPARRKSIPHGARLLSKSEARRMMAGAPPPASRRAHEDRAERLAAEGQGGDTEVAHLTPGEVVVPLTLQTPEVMALLRRAARAQGIDLRCLTVGHGRINPKTGQEQFASMSTAKTWKTDPPKGVPNFVFTYDNSGRHLPGFSRSPLIPTTGSRSESGGGGSSAQAGGSVADSQTGAVAGGAVGQQPMGEEDVIDPEQRRAIDDMIRNQSREYLIGLKETLEDAQMKIGLATGAAGALALVHPLAVGAGIAAGVLGVSTAGLEYTLHEIDKKLSAREE